VYLGLALVVAPPDGGPVDNEIVLVDDAGAVIARHRKWFLSPGEAAVPGEPHVAIAASPFGTLAAAICSEFSRHRLLAESGRAGADLLLDPSSEWEPLSTSVAITRAVENGASLVKATRGAPSVATDATGRVLAWADPSPRADNVMVADVPVRGTRTVYSAIGDAFACACAAALLLLAVRGRS
jgi:apolipoprotein N-acyltransferase